MKLRTLFQLLVILSLSACGPVGISTATPTPPSSTGLPDLVISNVYLAMQDIPANLSCVLAYTPYEIRATVENRGTAPAANVIAVEQSTQQQVRIGELQAMQSVEIQIPLSPAGSYTVVVDPGNLVMESNEYNNVLAYIAPTPTPPALCTPTSETAPTLPSPTPSPQSLKGLFYANTNLAQIYMVSSNDQSIQLIGGTTAQFSPDGSQDLFERSGDLWLAEPMDNPGVNLTKTPERNEQFPQWWPANPEKIVFNSVDIKEAQEKNWGHEISGNLAMMNKDGSQSTVLSDVPSYTRPALSPDGKTIAYDELGKPMLYEIGVGSRPFDISEYSFQTESASTVFTSPSFSPDGHWLTWWTSEGPSASDRHFSLVRFALTLKTALTLHTYTAPAGTLGWLDTPVWSPGGQWLAFQTRGESTLQDLWITHYDGGLTGQIGLATNPVWSPDGQRLAYVQWPPRTDPSLTTKIAMVQVPTWNAEQIDLPPESIPLSWIMIPQ